MASAKKSASGRGGKSASKKSSSKSTGGRVSRSSSGKKASSPKKSVAKRSAVKKSSAKKTSAKKSSPTRRPARSTTSSKKSPTTRLSVNSSSRSSKTTTDHAEIKRWVEARGGYPATVMGTETRDDEPGVLRIDYPGYSGAGTLERIDWEDWFEKFDEENLAFVYQPKARSRFSKLVRQT